MQTDWYFFIFHFRFVFYHSNQRYNVVAKSIAYYFLPLSIIAVLYALMARRLHLSAREMPGELAGPQRAQARARRHVARMVVTFVIGMPYKMHKMQITVIHISFNLIWFQCLPFAFYLIMCLCFGSTCKYDFNPLAMHHSTLCFFIFHNYFDKFDKCNRNPTSEDDFDTFWHITRITGFCLRFVS